jgi:hypothetical protein
MLRYYVIGMLGGAIALVATGLAGIHFYVGRAPALIVLGTALFFGFVWKRIAGSVPTRQEPHALEREPMYNRAQIIGTVRKIDWRDEERKHKFTGKPSDAVKVCIFRIEGTDKDGNPQYLATIEIRSESGFLGSLSEGDRIAVYDTDRNASGSISTSAVRNLMTGGIFGAKKELNRGFEVPPAEVPPA